jgi:hypothetical protein
VGTTPAHPGSRAARCLTWLAVLCATIACLSTGRARAGDQKTYPGSFCRPNLLDAFDRSYFLSVTGYYFQIAETPQVLCPVLRDLTTNTDGLADIELWISAPGEGSVGCGLYMLDAPGMIVGQGSRGVDFGPEGGVKKIDFSSMDGTPIHGEGLSKEGPMGIACSLPRGFAIIGYMIEESGSGDSD